MATGIHKSDGKVQSMWDEHFGKRFDAKLRIELCPPDAVPIHPAPYQASPRQRNLEKKDVGQMIKVGVTETATIEWAYPLISSQ